MYSEFCCCLMMPCSLQSIILLVLLLNYSVEGSSYCMTDCDSKGQRYYTKYEGLCCSQLHKGDIIRITKDNGRIGYVICPDTIPKWCPVKSCYDLLQSQPASTSGYHFITLSNGSQVEVYCDMEGSHCDGEGGWTRVALVNMSEPGSSCPPGLVQYDNIFNTSLCWINKGTNSYIGCNSAFFSPYGVNYTKVCGRLRGYQYGHPDAILCNVNNQNCFNSEIKTYGVTITYYSNPRKHIWTYIAGHTDNGIDERFCPCNNGSYFANYTIPFVGNDYYCESGLIPEEWDWYPLYRNDPLWDGQHCSRREATCCTNPKMPWFVKTLQETVSDSIELNVCGWTNDRESKYVGSPLNLIELYVK